jgi:hypothetical protein
MKLKELKKEYDKAVKENKETFEIEDVLILTAYAKYLIEYIEKTMKLNDEDEIELKNKQTTNFNNN